MHLGLSMRRPRDELQGEERSLHFGRDDRKHLRAVRGSAHDRKMPTTRTASSWLPG